MFKLPDLNISVREGPVTVTTTVPGLHVPCPSETEEFFNSILPDPLGIRRDVMRPLLKPHVDALDELSHLVTEGRDQGTVVFPEAACKIFLTASAEERARRRAREQHARGEPVDWREVLSQQEERDRRDAARPVGQLRKAADAVEVATDGMAEEDVVAQLEELVRQRADASRK